MEKRLKRTDCIAHDEPPAESRRDRNFLIGLGALAIASEAVYVWLVRLNAIDGLRPVSTFVAAMMALFAMYGLAFLLFRWVRFQMKAGITIVMLGAVIFRITLIPAGLPHDATAPELLQEVRADLQGKAVSFDRYLLYDDDIWRYLWDGHVWASSVNPFRFAPDDSRLDYLTATTAVDETTASTPWQDIRDNINHARVPTIYPPLAQVVFRLSHAIAPGSVIALKAILVAFDLLTLLLVYLVLRNQGSHPAWLLLYAWNPLLIKVVAGSGHIDVLVGALLALTAYLLVKRAYLSAALALSGAVLVKLAPVVLIPFLAKRIGWRRSLVIPVVLLTAYLPFFHSGWAVFAGLTKFAREWEFNSAFFLVMRFLARPFAMDPALVAREVGAPTILATTVWFWQRDDGQPVTFSQVASVLGALILFSPTVMPWYLVWLLPLAVISRQSIWIWFTGLVCLAFFVMANGTLAVPVLALEYGVFLAIALQTWFSRRNREGLGRFRPPELHPHVADISGAAIVTNNTSIRIPKRRNR